MVTGKGRLANENSAHIFVLLPRNVSEHGYALGEELDVVVWWY